MLLKNAFVMNENFELKHLDLQIQNGKIAALAEHLDPESESEEIVDLTGKYLLPGFIDTHIHGACGHILADEGLTKEELYAITRYEVSQGVTAIAISNVSSSVEKILEQYDLVVEAATARDGARIAGIHAEGPFLNPKRKGAMDEKNIIRPNRAILDQMIAHAKGLLRMLTLAPECEGALELISYAVSKELTVSLGHSDATYEEAKAGIAAGAIQATHTFNAMRPFNHREPGILGAVLTEANVRCEMICDHVHLHPATLQLIYKLKSADYINIISDSEYGTGIEEKEFLINGQIRTVCDGVMRLPNGTIAGSASSMLVGIKNLLSMGISIEEVSKMASLGPAKSLKLDHELGSIAVGKQADLVVLDSDYNVEITFVDGVCEYRR